jgi:hypothetical protein
MTKACWDWKKNEIQKTLPSLTRKRFVYNISRSDYRREWDPTYERPGIFARFLAFLLRILPKIGPLRTFAFKPPPATAETMFLKSFNSSLAEYRRLLDEQAQGTLRLREQNFDTGQPTQPATYRLADEAYAKLLDKLNGKPVPDDLRANILAYYSDLNAPFDTKRHPKEWKKLLKELDAVKSAAPTRSSSLDEDR